MLHITVIPIIHLNNIRNAFAIIKKADSLEIESNVDSLIVQFPVNVINLYGMDLMLHSNSSK